MNKVDNFNRYDAIVTTPFSTIGLCFQQHRLIALDFLTDRAEKHSTDPLVQEVCRQIQLYGETHSVFKKFEINISVAGTDFQQDVLAALQQIPYGCTQTYGEIAKKLNTSARAVGNACRRNPLPLIIPCHRVVAANGLGGYSGATSGYLLAIKYCLLSHEGSLVSH